MSEKPIDPLPHPDSIEAQDVIAHWIAQAHAAGLPLITNTNTSRARAVPYLRSDGTQHTMDGVPLFVDVTPKDGEE